MKGALEFWTFFLSMLSAAAAVGVLLCGPAALVWWLVGPWPAVAVCMISLVVLVTAVTWRSE
jgi:hypothetical protein